MLFWPQFTLISALYCPYGDHKPQIWPNLRYFSVSHIFLLIRGKFGTQKWTCGVLFYARFHFHLCIVLIEIVNLLNWLIFVRFNSVCDDDNDFCSQHHCIWLLDTTAQALSSCCYNMVLMFMQKIKGKYLTVMFCVLLSNAGMIEIGNSFN